MLSLNESIAREYGVVAAEYRDHKRYYRIAFPRASHLSLILKSQLLHNEEDGGNKCQLPGMKPGVRHLTPLLSLCLKASKNYVFGIGG